MNEIISTLEKVYNEINQDIKEKLRGFREKNKKGIKMELVFCLLTPQSEAKNCWRAVKKIEKQKFPSEEKIILKYLDGIRFKFKKANYVKQALENFDNTYRRIKREKDYFKLREYLVENIKGIGWKEASHFLRNIGKGDNFAILDRHVLNCLKRYKVIKEIPLNISKKNYFKIENKMKNFSARLKIPISHLDFLFWYIEKGEIFK